MKKKRRTGVFPADVSRVQRLVGRWRETRRKRGRMPEEIWREAVGAARRHGVYCTAKAAGLSYDSLKRRLAQGGEVGGSHHDAILGGFVEVNPAAVLGCSHETMTTIEMHRPDGVRVVIRVASGTHLDVAALCSAACGGAQ